jgi:hypothetical protein
MKPIKLSKTSFIPAFPIKTSPKSPSRKRAPLATIPKLSSKFCKELLLIPPSPPTAIFPNTVRNQTNFCEMRTLIMSPIRSKRLEIFIPDVTVSSLKLRPRKLTTALTRRKSAESKVPGLCFAEQPAEIITTRFSARVSSAKPRPNTSQQREMRLVSKSSNFARSLMREKTIMSTASRIRGNNRIGDTESASPTMFSPIYTANEIYS